MVVVMAVLVVVVMLVVVAAVGRHGQLAAQVGGHQRLNGSVWRSGTDGNAVMGKSGQRALPDAARDDDLNALFTQPSRKQSRLMWRGGNDLCGPHRLRLRIRFDEGEGATAAKVTMQATVAHGDGNAERWSLSVGSRIHIIRHVWSK